MLNHSHLTRHDNISGSCLLGSEARRSVDDCGSPKRSYGQNAVNLRVNENYFTVTGNIE